MGCCHSTAAGVEETVKEVLSETPNPKPYNPLPKAHVNRRQIESPFIKIAPLLDAAGNEDLFEEVSEICSSVSASTEKRGNRERRHPSPPKAISSRSLSGEVKVEKPVGRSPGRRSDPSPNRVAPESGYGRRREAGESSGRRSRSPVTRSEPPSVKTGHGLARQTGKSPSRFRSGLEEKTRKLDDRATVPSNDQLDNPLVSLECFIFL